MGELFQNRVSCHRPKKFWYNVVFLIDRATKPTRKAMIAAETTNFPVSPSGVCHSRLDGTLSPHHFHPSHRLFLYANPARRTATTQGVERLAEKIDQNYGDQSLTVVAVMTGSLVLFADLIRMLSMPLRVGVIQASSYRGCHDRWRAGGRYADDDRCGWPRRTVGRRHF